MPSGRHDARACGLDSVLGRRVLICCGVMGLRLQPTGREADSSEASGPNFHIVRILALVEEGQGAHLTTQLSRYWTPGCASC
jgi:hypothetical protein